MRILKTRIKEALLPIVLLCTGCYSQAQNTHPLADHRNTTHALLVGGGTSHLYDTYLSPLSYKGGHVNLLYETLRKTHWLEGRITTQSFVDGNLFITENPRGTANEMGGTCNYSIGWQYNWTFRNPLRIQLGGNLHVGVGCIYNTRNSNNPAQALAEIDLGTTIALIYPFKIKKHPFTARYQGIFPLLGTKFMPRYGQSYYEISQGHLDKDIRCTYPGNAPSMRHLITLDFPLSGFTFRAGYLCNIRQSQLNGIRQHIWQHSLMIGYVKHFRFIKKKDAEHRSFIL